MFSQRILTLELEDDNTEHDSESFSGRIVGDFLRDFCDNEKQPETLDALNVELKACGIKPIEPYVLFEWHCADVQTVRPDLTDEQALDVLLTAKHYHDANVGINWDVLKIWADELYPRKVE